MQKLGAAAEIVYLERDSLEMAIAVLSRAMQRDPLMQFIFEKSTVNYEPSLAELFRFSCAVRFDLDWPLLGCILESRLVGVAGVSEPQDTLWPESLSKTYDNFKSVVGLDATHRLERYSELADCYRPEAPHIHLGVLGVHPDFHGRGFADLLMKKIHAASERHPDSIGVALDTENVVNVPFYQHYGYSVTVKSELDGMDI